LTIFRARNERIAIGLMHAIFQSGGNAPVVPVASAAINNRAALHVKDGVAFGIIRRRTMARLGGGQHKIGNNDGHAINWKVVRCAPPDGASDIGALATMEPRTHAATLSGWPSILAASSRIRCGFQCRPSKWSAMTTPAVRAAALEPSPLPSGISLSIFECDLGKGIAYIGAHCQRGAPDEIVLTG